MTRKILRHAGLILLILLLLAGCGRRTADPAAENAESVSQTLSLLPEAESASEETTQSGGEDAGSSGENTSAAESASVSENAAGEESVSGSGNASGEESAEDPAGAGGEESAEESGGTDTAPESGTSSAGNAAGPEENELPEDDTPSGNDREEHKSSESGTADGGLTVTEDGWYSSKEEVALYIHTYGKLPENFLTKREAEELGWDKSYGSLWRVAPGMSIGGSRFGNYEKLLPEKKGRKYFECDIDYNGKTRGAKRIVFSNDGLVYYTGDHYESFELLYGEP